MVTPFTVWRQSPLIPPQSPERIGLIAGSDGIVMGGGGGTWVRAATAAVAARSADGDRGGGLPTVGPDGDELVGAGRDRGRDGAGGGEETLVTGAGGAENGAA